MASPGEKLKRGLLSLPSYLSTPHDNLRIVAFSKKIQVSNNTPVE
jgi:hypothetical protein